jgi:hypothetical protein
MKISAIRSFAKSICNWLKKNRQTLIFTAKSLVFIAVLCLGFYYALVFPWGEWQPRVWKTQPAKEANPQVLTAILAQNREEVRFWQGLLFNMSLAFIASQLGILSLALKARVVSDWLRWTYALAVVFLCSFYLTFVKVAEEAIALNHSDLTGIEIGLKLSNLGDYIKGERIYDHRTKNQEQRRGEVFIKRLVPFNILLAVFSVGAVLFLPIPFRRRNRQAPANRTPALVLPVSQLP